MNRSFPEFDLSQATFVRVDEMPVLLSVCSPSWWRRYAVLTPVVGAVNEVTLRLNLISPFGQDGVWRPRRTRVIPQDELAHLAATTGPRWS